MHTGRHFLQIPGPTNVPDRVLRAMSQPVIYPSSGTGSCEAALANTLSPGDRVLIFETGWFSHIAWRRTAEKLGLNVEYVPGSWRRGVPPAEVEARLRADAKQEFKAVIVVHNETSTGATSRIGEIRKAM